MTAARGTGNRSPLSRRRDKAPNAFAVIDLGAKIEIVGGSLNIERSPCGFRPARIDFKADRPARSGGCSGDVIRRDLFRVGDEVTELLPAPGEVCLYRGACGIVDVNIRPIRHGRDVRWPARYSRAHDFLD